MIIELGSLKKNKNNVEKALLGPWGKELRNILINGGKNVITCNSLIGVFLRAILL